MRRLERYHLQEAVHIFHLHLQAQRSWLANGSNVATAVTASGDITNDNAGVFAIGVNKVSNTMLRQSSGLSVIGTTSSTTANVADITAGTDKTILRRSGTSLAFGLIDSTYWNQFSTQVRPLFSGTSGHFI
jgi:hypothetical protein